MANEEQLEILKQGVEVWNEWRKQNPDTAIDLLGADFGSPDQGETYLPFANFNEANLLKANFFRARLTEAEFFEADLTEADFYGANLSGAILRESKLSRAYLYRADLRGADLLGADLWGADLRKADLRGANLIAANLRNADLTNALLNGAIFKENILVECSFNKTRMGQNIFGNIDLSKAIGLENVRHDGPSTIGTDTVQKSTGKVPIEFLRGCGLSDWEIESAKLYNPDLSNEEFIDIQNRIFELRNRQALQISSLFISYSHANNEFVDKVGDSLTQKGIRYWRDIHDMKAGRMEKQIDRAIRHNPTVLLVLSENSIKSDWVEHEVRTARELEKELGRDTLCPVALDDSWKSSPWPKRVMEQVMEYNILDFSGWEDDVKFEGIFRRLIDGLELFYKG